MELTQVSAEAARADPAFRAQAFLDVRGRGKTIAKYGRGETIFTQGDAGDDVLCIQNGGVKLSVRSKAGREACVATLGRGDFFGEACLAGQPVRLTSASAITPSMILSVDKDEMARLLHRQHAMSDLFIAHLLSRNIRIEEDLIEHVVGSIEKRLASALWLMAKFGRGGKPIALPAISRDTLAEMTGATPARVRFFLTKFTTLGFVESDGETVVKIDRSLLSVVLHN